MTAHRLTAVDVAKAMGRGEDGQWVRAVLAGRNQTGLRELSDYLRQAHQLPGTWPDMAKATGIERGSVRHVGMVGAGNGADTEGDFEPVLLPTSWISPNSCGLTVTGHSMYPVIRHGDDLLCEPLSECKEHYVMVFRTSEGLVVKYPVMGLHGWLLCSFNEAFPPIPATDAEAVPIALVEGIYRGGRLHDAEMAVRKPGGFHAEVLKLKMSEANFFA